MAKKKKPPVKKTLYLSAGTAKQLRIMAARGGTTMSQFAEDAIKAMLAYHQD